MFAQSHHQFAEINKSVVAAQVRTGHGNWLAVFRRHHAKFCEAQVHSMRAEEVRVSRPLAFYVCLQYNTDNLVQSFLTFSKSSVVQLVKHKMSSSVGQTTRNAPEIQLDVDHM